MALVEPEPHQWPAAHNPEHATVARPGVAPKDPAGHAKAVALGAPRRPPAGQGLREPPGGHHELFTEYQSVALCAQAMAGRAQGSCRQAWPGKH